MSSPLQTPQQPTTEAGSEGGDRCPCLASSCLSHHQNPASLPTTLLHLLPAALFFSDLCFFFSDLRVCCFFCGMLLSPCSHPSLSSYCPVTLHISILHHFLQEPFEVLVFIPTCPPFLSEPLLSCDSLSSPASVASTGLWSSGDQGPCLVTVFCPSCLIQCLPCGIFHCLLNK